MSKEQDVAIQNHLTTYLATNILVGQDEDSNKFMETQAELLSSIKWNMFFVPLGLIALFILQGVLINHLGHNLLFSILGAVAVFFLLRTTRLSIEKSFYQARSNEVNQVTRVIAKYISDIGTKNGLSLNSVKPDQAGADGVQAVQAPSEENKDSIR